MQILHNRAYITNKSLWSPAEITTNYESSIGYRGWCLWREPPISSPSFTQLRFCSSTIHKMLWSKSSLMRHLCPLKHMLWSDACLMSHPSTIQGMLWPDTGLLSMTSPCKHILRAHARVLCKFRTCHKLLSCHRRDFNSLGFTWSAFPSFKKTFPLGPLRPFRPLRRWRRRLAEGVTGAAGPCTRSWRSCGSWKICLNFCDFTLFLERILLRTRSFFKSEVFPLKRRRLAWPTRLHTLTWPVGLCWPISFWWTITLSHRLWRPWCSLEKSHEVHGASIFKDFHPRIRRHVAQRLMDLLGSKQQHGPVVGCPQHPSTVLDLFPSVVIPFADFEEEQPGRLDLAVAVDGSF